MIEWLPIQLEYNGRGSFIVGTLFVILQWLVLTFLTIVVIKAAWSLW